MTEQEWMICDEPHRMMNVAVIRSMLRNGDARRLRLFATACFREIAHHFRDERSVQAVEVAEQFVDGAVGKTEVKLAVQSAISRLRDVGTDIDSTTPTDLVMIRLSALAALDVCRTDAYEAATRAAAKTGRVEAFASVLPLADSFIDRSDVFAARLAVAKKNQCEFLRDIFGNPFRDVPPIRNLPTQSAMALARSIYEQRTFDHLPVLADALEEGGCTNADILSHCRSPGPHLRGCWALDLLLGKT